MSVASEYVIPELEVQISKGPLRDGLVVGRREPGREVVFAR